MMLNVSVLHLKYRYSDGYFDQINEKSKKKILRSRFKQILEECMQEELGMDQYSEKLTSFLEEWQGDEKQIDDILVIGVRGFSDTSDDFFY